MKKNYSKIINALILIAIVYLLAQKAPHIWAQFKSEGTKISDFSVLTNSGSELNTQDLKTKKVLVFWATWCPPCELELSRINDLVKDKRISADSVLAISMGEEKPLVDRIAQERGYEFHIGYDFDGKIGQQLAVAGTPTVIFLKEDKTISWVTTGLSPLLKLRMNVFLD